MELVNKRFDNKCFLSEQTWRSTGARDHERGSSVAGAFLVSDNSTKGNISFASSSRRQPRLHQSQLLKIHSVEPAVAERSQQTAQRNPRAQRENRVAE